MKSLVKQLEDKYWNDKTFSEEVTRIFERILPVQKEFESGGFERAVKFCKDNYPEDWYSAYSYFYWQVWIDIQPDLRKVQTYLQDFDKDLEGQNSLLL